MKDAAFQSTADINSDSKSGSKVIAWALWISLLGGIGIAEADVSGTVFRDLPVNGASANTYGKKDANETGVAGITVNAVDASGTTGSATTTADGTWSISGLSGQVRVVFDNLPSYLKPSEIGDNSATTVQFANEGNNDIDLGVHNPADYSSDNPLIAIPIFVNGDQTADKQTLDVKDYRNNGILQHIANDTDTGAIWGLAYSPDQKILYASAVLRRHVGLGSEGLDGIYVIDYSAGTGDGNFLTPINLSTLGVDVGTDPRTAALPSSVSSPSRDIEAFEQLGKIGIGDIDMSEDGKTLYAINLKAKEVVALDVSNPASVSLISQTAIPDPGCNAGEHRPWALDIHDGAVYVGMVCDASNGGDRSDLDLYVKKLSGSTFSDVYHMELDYTRTGDYASGGSVIMSGPNSQWLPWADVWNGHGYSGFYRHSEPMLLDIEFDTDGSLILMLVARNGLRTGNRNYSIDTSDSSLYVGRARGDVLRVCSVNGNLVLEGGTGCDFNFTQAEHKNFGQGEFYMDNAPRVNGDGHTETHMGGGAILAGSGQLLTAGQTDWNAGGFVWFDNTDGSRTDTLTVYDTNTDFDMDKAAGVGDIELLTEPAPLEIGNRVWEDLDGDGEQDAGEPGMNGVTVTLTCGANSAQKITSGDGNYLFTDTDFTNGIPRNSSCSLTLADSQTGSNGNVSFIPNPGAVNDVVDSDGNANGGTVTETITTGSAGHNSHRYDFGFGTIAPPPADIDLSITKAANKSSAKTGDTVVYTLVVTNSSSTVATNVVIQDVLPNGVTYSSATGGTSHTESNGVVSWEIASVAANSSETLTVTVTID